MDETKRRIDLRAVLGVLAVMLAVAAFWGASAFAASGWSSESGTNDSPAAANVQSESQNENEAPDEDCPDRDSDSESSSDV